MDSYTKDITLKVQVDASDIQKIEKQFDDLAISHLISKEAYDEFKKQYVEIQTRAETIKTLKKSISEIKMFGGEDSAKILKELESQLKKIEGTEEEGISKDIKDAFKKDGFIGKKVIDGIEELFDKVIDFAKEMFSEAINNLNEMASFDVANSLVINREARNLMMQYGLSSSQAYAYSKTAEEMGIQSEEDLFWMNESQRERFAERIGYYSGKYEESYNQDFFKSWQEFQISWQEFKTEIGMELVQFFIDNKDTIMNFMKLGMQFMEATVAVLGEILNLMGSPLRSSSSQIATTQEIIQNASSNTSNTNVKVDNTFNLAGMSSEALPNFGNIIYEQIVNALK